MKKYVLGILFLLSFVLIPPAFALDTTQTTTTNSTTTITRTFGPTILPTMTKVPLSQPPLLPSQKDKPLQNTASPSSRLKQSQINTCKQISQVMLTRFKKAIEEINKEAKQLITIAQAAQKYYLTILEPEDKTLTQYRTAYNLLQIQNNALQQEINNFSNDINTFSCTSDNPKQQISTLQSDLKKAFEALKIYKAEVKEFLTNLKDVAPKTETTVTPSTKL